MKERAINVPGGATRIAGGGGLVATGRGRQSGLFVLSSGGVEHQTVSGYGFMITLRTTNSWHVLKKCIQYVRVV